MKLKGQPNRIGKYSIAGVLGHGGMGSVYRVIHPDNDQIVALKLLNPSGPLTDLIEEQKLHQIFTNEIRTMSRLHHPNITEVLDTGFDKGWPFYTMEYFCNDLGMLIGENFIVEESSRSVPPQQAVDYGCQILSGLQYMHDAGILHRDIKPYNMMLNNKGIIKICDFGMARIKTEEPFNTEGINIGSPYYTAPEQIKNADKADSRADLYSAAVIIYRMLTCVLPSMADFMLSYVDPLYDPSWDRFFARALCWNPELRFQNAREMADELTRLELHWEKEKGKECRNIDVKALPGTEIPLRTNPVRVSGTQARETFAVDKLWQPRNCIKNIFNPADNKTVLDGTTGLLWQRTPSDYPLDRVSAEIFVETLNEISFQGIQSWRLPTVNELLSLVNESDNPRKKTDETHLQNDSEWFWSCDRRSPETSWYVNTGIGYTGWQNNSCLYSVRAVASVKHRNNS